MKEHIKYINPEDIATSGYYVSYLYGDMGKRKTVTACSMVKEKGLLVSSDQSWIVLKKDIHKEIAKRITIVEYEGWTQLEYLDYEKYDTAIFDTTSKMITMYLDLLFDKADWGKNSQGKPKYREAMVSRDPLLNNLSTTAPIDYKVTRDVFRPVFNKIMQLPCHKIFTSQVHMPSPLNDKDTIIRPDIPQATSRLVGEFASVLGYIHSKKEGIVIGVDETAMSYLGKSRIEGIQGTMLLDNFIKTYRSVI